MRVVLLLSSLWIVACSPNQAEFVTSCFNKCAQIDSECGDWCTNGGTGIEACTFNAEDCLVSCAENPDLVSRCLPELLALSECEATYATANVCRGWTPAHCGWEVSEVGLCSGSNPDVTPDE